MDGRFTIGMQGFGRSKVRGRSRVPSPPHMIHTFIRVCFTRSVLTVLREGEGTPKRIETNLWESLILSCRKFVTMAEETRKRILTRRELYISIAIPALCFGGAALGILLETRGIISEAGSLYWGSVAGSFLLAYLAWIKPRKDIVALLAPLYAVIIFIVALEAQPTILLQLLFGASLTILVVRLNILFSTPPVKKHGEDTMEQYLYDYMHRITPYYRGIDRETAHEVASAVLSFKFGLYPNSMSSAESAVSRITAGAAYETLKKALVIITDRASSL